MAAAMTFGMLAGCGSKAEDTTTEAPAAETTTTDAEASTSVSGDVKVAYMAKNVVDAFAVNMNNSRPRRKSPSCHNRGRASAVWSSAPSYCGPACK